MTFTPTRRYSAVAVFSEDLERVVLIHKQRPAWQAGKANFPGGKVEAKDWPPPPEQEGDYYMEGVQEAYLACAVRELQEETSLVVAVDDLKLFCTLRFRDLASGDDGECQFFCCVCDVRAAATKESEQVFVADAEYLMCQGRTRYYLERDDGTHKLISIPTLPNLPWLTAMARQTLRDGKSKVPPFVVYEAGVQ